MTGHAELVRELKALRKGRGLYVNNVGERVGPALRDLCRVTEQDGLGEIRVRVAERLERLAADLPDDLRMATLAAFGMIPAARHPLYQERVGWIARQMERDPRTVRRRIDDAIHQLAERAVTRYACSTGPSPRPPLWHVEEIRMVLLLDHAATEVLELHRIVAGQDHLRELELPTTFGQPEVIDVRPSGGGPRRSSGEG